MRAGGIGEVYVRLHLYVTFAGAFGFFVFSIPPRKATRRARLPQASPMILRRLRTSAETLPYWSVLSSATLFEYEFKFLFLFIAESRRQNELAGKGER